MKNSTLALIAFLISCISLFGQGSIELDSSDEMKLDSVCNTYLKDSQVPGFAVGVIKNGKVLYSKGFGIKNIDTQEPVTSKSIFHMASISKTFVATGLIQLLEKQKIQLDDPIIKHLPYFEMKDERYKDITIRQMLIHTSGVPDIGVSENYEWDKPQYDSGALERYVRSLKSSKLDFKPGKKYRYSNSAYNVLGDVIAKVSNMSFEEYMETYILKPIEMKNSTFLKTEISKDLATSPHLKNKNKQVVVSEVYPYNRMHAPCGTLNSNVDDMLKYAITYLNQGTYQGTQIFSTNSYQLLTTKQWKINKVFDIGLCWNLAPFRSESNIKKRIEHSGRDIGYQSWFFYVPDSSFAVIILRNGDFTPPAFGVVNTAFDIANKYE